MLSTVSAPFFFSFVFYLIYTDFKLIPVFSFAIVLLSVVHMALAAAAPGSPPQHPNAFAPSLATAGLELSPTTASAAPVTPSGTAAATRVLRFGSGNSHSATASPQSVAATSLIGETAGAASASHHSSPASTHSSSPLQLHSTSLHSVSNSPQHGAGSARSTPRSSHSHVVSAAHTPTTSGAAASAVVTVPLASPTHTHTATPPASTPSPSGLPTPDPARPLNFEDASSTTASPNTTQTNSSVAVHNTGSGEGGAGGRRLHHRRVLHPHVPSNSNTPPTHATHSLKRSAKRVSFDSPPPLTAPPTTTTTTATVQAVAAAPASAPSHALFASPSAGAALIATPPPHARVSVRRPKAGTAAPSVVSSDSLPPSQYHAEYTAHTQSSSHSHHSAHSLAVPNAQHSHALLATPTTTKMASAAGTATPASNGAGAVVGTPQQPILYNAHHMNSQPNNKSRKHKHRNRHKAVTKASPSDHKAVTSLHAALTASELAAAASTPLRVQLSPPPASATATTSSPVTQVITVPRAAVDEGFEKTECRSFTAHVFDAASGTWKPVRALRLVFACVLVIACALNSFLCVAGTCERRRERRRIQSVRLSHSER